MRLFFLLLSIILFLTGCSDNGKNVNEFAYLIDAPVEGVSYRCNDFNGTTASDGSFEYLSDCIIEFSVGGIALGEIPAALINDDKRVFLSELFGLDRDDISDPALIKLLQLLQSLDEDDNASNGIMISEDTGAKLSGTSLEMFSGSATEADINAALTDIGETLIDAQSALVHYIATLKSELDITFQTPTLLDFSVTVAENTIIGTAVGTITVADAGDTAISSFVLSGNGAGDFYIADDRTITVAKTLDYANQQNYSLSVIAINASGGSDPVNVNIGVLALNSRVPVLSSSSILINENTPAGTQVGNIVISDPGDSTVTAITLSGTNASHFSVEANGTITVVTPPDYETQAIYNLSAVATNSAGASTSIPVTITVTDVAEMVPTLAAYSTELPENTAEGTVIGTVTITEPGDSAIISMALSGSGYEHFNISSDGTLVVADTLDFETQTSYTLSAVATNSAGTSDPVDVTVTVTNVVDVVPTLAAFSTTLLENAAVGTTVGSINISDPGDSAVTSITLSGTNASHFSAAADGTITVVTPPDYETQSSYTLSAVATNSAGSSTPVNVTITITDSASEVVPTLSGSTATVVENTTVGTAIGTVTITDPGDSAITAITLSGTNHSHFSAAADGTITVVTSPDYETQTSYNLSAVATNTAGASALVPVTITVTDVADVVPVLAPFGTTVSENTASGTVIGMVTITEQGDSTITSIALSGSGSGDFSVSNDGTITVVTPPDYETQSSYTLSAVATSASGESDPVNVTITISNASVIEEVKLVASDAHETDHFGASVDISGDYLVVGAEGDTSKSGAAYVYRKDGSGSFYEIAELNALDAGIYDRFGIAVSIDGPYVVVGAQRADLLSATDAGAAYVFKNNGSDNYEQVAKLTAFDAAEDDHFGFSVAIDGDYVVVCADNKASGTGAVYVYKNNGLDDSYDQVDKLTASDANSGDYFGYSVAISGDYMAATAFYEDPFGAGNAGSAYIFKRDAGADGFSQIAKLNALDFETGDHFGRAVAISGEYVAIGAFYEDPNGVSDAGSAYVFKNDGADNYNQVAKLMAVDGEESDHFGYAISVSGGYVVVGAYDEDQDGSSAGAVYLFQNDGTDGYSQVDKITASDAAAGDRFGYAVAVSGSDLLIGAYNEDPSGMTNAGSAYVYQIVP